MMIKNLKKITFKNSIDYTLEHFPEYKDTRYFKERENDQQYSFFAGFSEYLIEVIKNTSNPESDPYIVSVFKFINEMISSSDEKLSELAVIEILGDVVQDHQSNQVATKLLNEEGQKFLLEVHKYTGVTN